MNNLSQFYSRPLGALVLLTVTLGLTAGCGGQQKAHVSGSVSLDGVPVENGVIQFYPVGGSGQTAGAGIENGKYQLDASVGEMTVTINASKVVGKHKLYDTKDSPEVNTIKELVPAEYNTTSTLKVTLKPGQNDNVDFDLKTKKK